MDLAENSSEIILSDIKDVNEFVKLASENPFDVAVVSVRYVVDGKSIMGMFSLDLSKPVTVIIQCGRCTNF